MSQQNRLALVADQAADLRGMMLRVQELQMTIKLVHEVVKGYFKDKQDPTGMMVSILALLNSVLPKHERNPK